MRANPIAVAAALAFAVVIGFAVPGHGQAPAVAAFEGARLIVGDGRTIDNGTMIMEGARIMQVGGAADIRVPAGATRVNLAGKTVMPAIIDTHVHPSHTRDSARGGSDSGAPTTASAP